MAAAERTILVTGATGGIGRAVCERLAHSGCSLLLAARNPAKLKLLSEELPGPCAHRWVSVDMTRDGSVEEFATELAQRETSLDGLVLMPPQMPKSSDPMPANDIWRTNFQNCFVGPMALLKSAIERMGPELNKGRRSKVVIISAISSAQVLGNYALSNVIRCAWLGQAKTLAFALADRGIHVNTLSLGGVLTPDYTASIGQRAAQAGVTYDQRYAEETANIPLRKYGTPEEVAAAVAGLLSDFSDHMTGVNIMCDGGFTRAY